MEPYSWATSVLQGAREASHGKDHARYTYIHQSTGASKRDKDLAVSRAWMLWQRRSGCGSEQRVHQGASAGQACVLKWSQCTSNDLDSASRSLCSALQRGRRASGALDKVLASARYTWGSRPRFYTLPTSASWWASESLSEAEPIHYALRSRKPPPRRSPRGPGKHSFGSRVWPRPERPAESLDSLDS